MRTAIVHGGMAGALWGAVIVAPSLIPEVHPVVISCVRFLLYGLFATLLAVPIARSLISRLTRQDQLLLLELALTGNLVYFILLSAAVQYAGVATASLINGLIPVAVMLMGRCFRARCAVMVMVCITQCPATESRPLHPKGMVNTTGHNNRLRGLAT